MNEKEIYMNYKRNNKWLGIIDYKSLAFLVTYIVIIWNVINYLNIPLEYKLYIFMLITIPVIVLVCININSESAIDVLIILIKYNMKKKIYLDTHNINVNNVNKNCKIFSKFDKKI